MRKMIFKLLAIITNSASAFVRYRLSLRIPTYAVFRSDLLVSLLLSLLLTAMDYVMNTCNDYVTNKFISRYS